MANGTKTNKKEQSSLLMHMHILLQLLGNQNCHVIGFFKIIKMMEGLQ